MRQLVAGLLALLLLALGAIPAALVRGCGVPQPPREAPGARGLVVRAFAAETGVFMELPLEEYVKGVVAAEMPASFPLEALKAQAVVARTYVVKRMRVFGGSGCELHPGADICTDPAHNQAWVSQEELRERWGTWKWLRLWPKIELAVEETEGLIVVYAQEPIDPVYHSSSGGVTENSEDVWGQPLPYLRSVPSPWEEESPRLRGELVLTLEELKSRLGVETLGVETRHLPASAGPKAKGPAVEVVKRSSTGRVKLVRVADRLFSGTEFRRLLGLNSTLFELREEGSVLRFTTTGYGHGVGMSQWGAAGLAKLGRSYQEIIAHYYTGVSLRSIFVE